MMYRLTFLMLVLHSLCSAQSLINYVLPLTGTQRMGHTYPGATVPFGAVQLSPETDTLPYEVNGHYNKDVYKYCAGYQYEDKTIVGFAHTHFSGTGHSDLGDILIMPANGPMKLNPGTADMPGSGYRSSYTHNRENASPGYYVVHLQDPDVTAELTASSRVGVHQYTFHTAATPHIVLDMAYGIYNYPAKNVWTYMRMENDTLITGYRQTTGWGRTRTVYFAIATSRPITSYHCINREPRQVYRGFWKKFNTEDNFPEAAGRQVKGAFYFDIKPGEKLMMKVAISPVSTDNARQNMAAEVPGWNFAAVREHAQALWQQELSKIKIKAAPEVMQNFYTAMYHAMLSPTEYMDVNKQYRGLDQNVHTAAGINYSTFSLWDTYRALHPFLNLIQPTRNADMVNSMLSHYDQSVHHMLPVWSHYANENWCMIGYHSVSVIADAIVKNVGGFDNARALDACVATARHRTYDGLGYYMDMGYVPEDANGASVSKTLEYAYDDWCIAQAAQKLGKTDIYNEFMKRSGYYKNVFDPSTGFMRPRLKDGSFKKQFDVLNTDEPGFIEGNTWNYSLYVPHAPQDMIKLMGGTKRFVPHLDSLFDMQLPDSFFAHTEDITRDGIIGNYVHGNEPSHHIAYLYNYTHQPWKTQERVRMIMDKMYHPGPAGLSGNDDCGQMSAWYILSAMGFYPMAPGSDRYELGSPAIVEATLHLENGHTLTITAHNQGEKNVYVKKVLLNGKKLDRSYITHAELMTGGSLEYFMSATR